jgi:hypothetical protein
MIKNHRITKYLLQNGGFFPALFNITKDKINNKKLLARRINHSLKSQQKIFSSRVHYSNYPAIDWSLFQAQLASSKRNG